MQVYNYISSRLGTLISQFLSGTPRPMKEFHSLPISQTRISILLQVSGLPLNGEVLLNLQFMGKGDPLPHDKSKSFVDEIELIPEDLLDRHVGLISSSLLNVWQPIILFCCRVL